MRHVIVKVVEQEAVRMASGPMSSADLATLYRHEREAMVRLARLLTGSPVLAEEIVQDAFLKMQQLHEQPLNPHGYLRTTVANLAAAACAAFAWSVGPGPRTASSSRSPTSTRRGRRSVGCPSANGPCSFFATTKTCQRVTSPRRWAVAWEPSSRPSTEHWHDCEESWHERRRSP